MNVDYGISMTPDPTQLRSKYTVIEAESLSVLINDVNKYLDVGWELEGGVCRDRYWYQAMSAPSKALEQAKEGE